MRSVVDAGALVESIDSCLPGYDFGTVHVFEYRCLLTIMAAVPAHASLGSLKYCVFRSWYDHFR